MSSVYAADMESIDSLAKMINNFKGGLVLGRHDMRLISQVAKEIWICDKKKVGTFERRRRQGDITKSQASRQEGAAEEARPAR